MPPTRATAGPDETTESDHPTSSCCEATEQAQCCEPTAKAECCGADEEPTSCGCR
jgi:hypothetical protein